MKKVYQIILILTLSLLIVSCDDTITNQDIDNRIIPDANVSFSQHIYPVLQVKCFSCHGNGGYEAGLDLTLRSRFVDGRIVVPGDTLTSILVWRIDRPPRAGFNPMPPEFMPQLTPNQIRGIKIWIAEGALDN
uniref:Cytochrome C Planctomycete-type domain-containing protein n=1 Tax=Ignavibacterium album TaxID=591197 RepID=A0A7V3E6U3_9BACT